jgi:hypothetical protein
MDRDTNRVAHSGALSLWSLAIAPCVWAAHFLACYLTVAIWCEKYAAQSKHEWLLGLVASYTAVAFLLIALVARWSYRRFRQGDPPIPYDFDEPTDRTRFLSYTGCLLSALSAIATLFTALVFLFVRSCD